MAAFSISEFVSNLEKVGIARTCNYYVDVYPPGGGGQEIRYRAAGAEFPGRRIQYTNWTPYGPVFPIATGQEFNEITLDVILSPDLKEKALFEQWQNKAIGNSSDDNSTNVSNYDIGYFNSYTGQVVLHQLDDQLKTVKSYTLLQAYPLHVMALPLDWNNDDIQKLKVSIIFYRYVVQN